MKKGYKICPHCGKEIKKIAIKCQYCLKFLNEESEKKTIECPFCLNEIDINEKKCPYCDEALKKSILNYFYKKKTITYVIIGFVALLLTVLLVTGLLNKGNKKDLECKNINFDYENMVMNYYENSANDIFSDIGVFYSPTENKCLGHYIKYYSSSINNDKNYTFITEDIHGTKIASYHYNEYPEIASIRCFGSDFTSSPMIDLGDNCSYDNVKHIWNEEILRLKGN